MFVCNKAPRRYVVALVLGVLLIISPLSEGKRSLSGGGRKTSSSSGGYSTRRQPQTSVTKPTYNAGVPAGATYVPAGGALPPGAVLYSSPPQQSSSGLGFGAGLAGGAIGGAILGHVLTPSHRGGSAPAPAPVAGNAAGGDDRIIIINANGEPVKATTVNGATVINTGAPAVPGAAPMADTGAPVALAPMMPMTNDMSTAHNMTSDANPMPAVPIPIMSANATDNAVPMNPEQQPPASGGIICVPVRVNDTDPTDATKMIEVEKVACYPAPPPAPPAAVPETTDANNTQAPPQVPADGSAPLDISIIVGFILLPFHYLLHFSNK